MWNDGLMKRRKCKKRQEIRERDAIQRKITCKVFKGKNVGYSKNRKCLIVKDEKEGRRKKKEIKDL